MDKKRSLLNVGISIGFKILLLVGALLARRFLIQYVGNEVNGLNSLYTSIIGFLSVAELGIGSAITFCMYKPIVNKDNKTVAALYHLFTKIYLVIGGIILVGGLCIMPALPYLAKDYTVDVNLYLTFGLMLASTVISYLYSSKTSLINAYKDDYITTTINSLGMLLQYGLQMVVVVLTKSFTWYLLCHIIGILFQWGLTEIISRKKHGDVMILKEKVDQDTKSQVIRNVKAMFMHKIGGVLVNTADSLIISAFIGVVILGKYSNYTTIMNAMTGVLSLFFTPLVSVIGHLCVKGDVKEIKKYYNFFYTFNFILSCVFFLGYYGIIDNVVTICFGTDLEMAKSVSFVITLNYFIQFMRQSTLLFRDATGTFYYDRWKPIAEGVTNVILSIGAVYLFSWLFGEDFAVVGVIAATIVTNLFICHIVEPHVLHKYALKTTTKKFYIKNYFCIALFTVALFALHFSLQSNDSQLIELLINGFIAVAISLVPCAILILADKDFRHYANKALIKIGNKFKRKPKTAPAVQEHTTTPEETISAEEADTHNK